jgi:hypothetical protein
MPKFLHDGHFSGSSTDLTVDGNLHLANHVIPTADNTVDLGTTDSKDFRTLYIREIDVFNQRLRISYSGTIATLRDHSSVGDGFEFFHRGTSILRLGDGSDTEAIFAGNITSEGGTLQLGSDVTLFRDGTNILRTDDVLHANGHIHVGGVSGGGSIYNRADTSNNITFSSAGVAVSQNLTLAATRHLKFADDKITIGNTNSTLGNEAISIGYDADSTGNQSIGIGYNPAATGTYSVAIGYNVTASGTGTFVFGTSGSHSDNNTLVASELDLKVTGTGTSTFAGSVGIKTPSSFTANTSADDLVVGSGSGSQGITIYSGSGKSSAIYFADDLDEEGAGDSPAGNRDGVIKYEHANSRFNIRTAGNQDALILTNTSATFNGNVVVGNALYVPNEIYHTGNTNTSIRFPAQDQFRVVTGGGNRLQVENTKILVGDDVNMQYDGISTSNSGTVVYGGFLNPASEANMVHLPHVINDLAGFNKWSNATITTSGFYKTRSGSSGSYTYSNEVTNTDSGWANAFDAHSSTAGSWYSDNGSDGTYTHGVDTPGVVELEWTNEATYSLWAGIVFGSNSFTPTYVKIEAYRAGAWQTLCEITNNTDQVILRQVGSNSGTNAATRRLKYTLGGSVNGSYFRIHSLYMANYRAGDNNLNNTGTDTTRGVNFLERYKNNYAHGNFYPGAHNTYDIGSSSYKWKNIIGVNLHGDLVGTIHSSTTANTQSQGNNSTKVATTAYVDTAVSNLVDSAPSTLDTLNELAAALGDDANFSTTVTNSIAGKVSKSGDTMTGSLTIGSAGSGHDVKFFGDLSGEYFMWDENVSTVNIYHRDELPGLEVYVNAGGQTTQPQLKVGRSNTQYWGAYVDDRNAHLVHRQDETSGIMTTRFDQWDSNTSDNTGQWQWRSGNGTGGSMTTAAVLYQDGDFTVDGDLMPMTDGGGSLGKGSGTNLRWGGLELQSGAGIQWQNGDARIIEGLVNNYSLSFQTYDGSSMSTALRLDGNNNANFEGHVILPSAKYLEFSAMGKLINMDVSTWTSGQQEHNILYSGWTSSTGDYLSIKVPGNSASAHGNLIIGDNGLWFGRANVTDNAAATDSGTNPHPGSGSNYFRVNTAGDLQVSGSIISPIYYDTAGTTYYLDLGNTSISLNVPGAIQLQDSKAIMWSGNNILNHNGTQTYIGDNVSSTSVTITGGNVTIGGTGVDDTRSLTLQTNSEQNTVINLKEANANYGFSLMYDGSANDFIIKRHDNSAGGVSVLTLDRTNNNATFAGSVTATSFVKSGGTSSQYLMADGSVSTSAGGSIDGSGSANRLAIWSDSDTLTSDVNITVSGGELQLGNGLLVEDNDTTVITAKAYEPHIVWQKTRGSDGDDFFKIKAENDAMAVDFTTARDGGSDTRVLRIDSNNNFVFSTNGSYTQLHSSFMSVYGRLTSSSDIRSTQYYDYNDTTRYLDLNSTGTSIRANGTVHASNSNMSSYQLNGTYVMDSSRNLVNIGTISSTYITTSANINSTGDGGATLGGYRLGFDQAGTRSWTMQASGGNLNVFSGDSNGGFNVSGLSNGVITDKIITGSTHLTLDTSITARDLLVKTGSTTHLTIDGSDSSATFEGDVRADNIGLGSDATSFGTGVPTLLFKGTNSTNGRSGAVYFKENDGTDTAALYVTDGNDGYGTVLTAYQGSLKFATGSLTGTVLTLDQSNNANFAGNIYMNGNTAITSGRNFYGSVFYDAQNTAYFLNPAGDSTLYNAAGTFFRARFQATTNLTAGWYTIAANSGNRSQGRFRLTDRASSRHQAVEFLAAHHYGNNDSNTITVLDNGTYNVDVFRYLRIKEAGTYDGAVIQVYIDNSTNNCRVILEDQAWTDSGWTLKNFVADATDPGDVGNYSALSEQVRVDLDDIKYNGGITSTGKAHFNRNIESENEIRGVSFKDYDDTSYYLDPASTTTSLNVAGKVTIADNKAVEWGGGSIRAEGNTLKLVATTLIDLQDNTQIQGNLDVTTGVVEISQAATNLLTLTNTSNGGGAGVVFNDNNGGAQRIYLRGYHADGSSQGGGASLHLQSTEADLVFVVGSTSDDSYSGRIAVQSHHQNGEVDYGFVGDTNTGMYSPAAGQVGLVSDGSRKLNVNNNGVYIQNGNLYIPDHSLYVGNYIYHDGDTNTNMGFPSADTITFAAGGTERLRITGDVHVQGPTDLNINGTSRRISFTSGTGTVRTTTANNLYLQSNSQTVLELKSNLESEFFGNIKVPEYIYHSGDTDTYIRFTENAITLRAVGNDLLICQRYPGSGGSGAAVSAYAPQGLVAENLGGANLIKKGTDIAVASSSREEVTWADGTRKVQAHVSTGNGNSSNCYNWYSSENVRIDPEKDYEFSVWIKSTGDDHLYLGWHEYRADGTKISGNPYFHTSKIKTHANSNNSNTLQPNINGWVLLKYQLKSHRTTSGQSDTEGTDRYASNGNPYQTSGATGVMHSTTTHIHLRLGTCYGSVNGSKSYFYNPKITEAQNDDIDYIHKTVESCVKEKVSVPQGKKILFDGRSGHTYITEESDSNLKFYVAGTERMNVAGGTIHLQETVNIGDNELINNGATVFYDRTSPEIDYYDYSKLILETDSVELHSPGEFIFSGADPFIHFKKPSAGAFLNGNENVMKVGLISGFGPGMEAVDTTSANLNTDLHFIIQRGGSQYEAIKVTGKGDDTSKAQVYVKDNMTVSGKFGIGTTNPQSVLSVNGTSSLNGEVTLTQNKALVKRNCFFKTGGVRLQKATSTNDELNMRYEGQNSNSFVIEQYKSGSKKGQIKFNGDNNALQLSGTRLDIGSTSSGTTYLNSSTTNVAANKKVVFLDGRDTGDGLHFKHTGTGKTVQMGMFGNFGDSDRGSFKITQGTTEANMEGNVRFEILDNGKVKLGALSNTVVNSNETYGGPEISAYSKFNTTNPTCLLYHNYGNSQSSSSTLAESLRIQHASLNSNTGYQALITFRSTTNAIRGKISGRAAGVAYYTGSDARLKEDPKDFDGLNLIEQFKPYDFKWIDLPEEDRPDGYEELGRDYGLYAQEAKDIVPNAVDGDGSSDEMMQMDYSKLVPVLIKAVQQLSAKVKDLESKTQ